MSSWHNYPSIFNLGHRAVRDILSGPNIQVEEKIDGSQISFGAFVQHETYGDTYELRIRSKGANIVPDAPDKMFAPAVEVIKAMFNSGKIKPELTYSGEYLRKPKHNVLCYERIPANHIIIFDIRRDEEDYLSPTERELEAAWIGLEVVPVLHRGSITEIETIHKLLETTSILGRVPIEGVVVKDYSRFGMDKKALMAKYVSEAFKEIHGEEYRRGNPTSGDIVQQIVSRLKTEARWNKAVQHLRDSGLIEDSPKDIGKLLLEVWRDVEYEEVSDMKERLFKWAWPKIRRGVTAGLAEFYKQKLLKDSLNASQRSDSSNQVAGGLLASKKEDSLQDKTGLLEGHSS